MAIRSVSAQESGNVPLASQQKKLILVVGVEPQERRRRMTPELLTSVMRQAIEKTNDAFKCTGNPAVMPLSPVFYSEFNRLVEKTDPRANQSLEGAADGILVTPSSETIEEFSHVFRVTLREPGKYLYQLKVEYEDETTESFSPSDEKTEQVSQSGTDSQDRAQYWVRLKKYPRGYTITAKELGAVDQTYSGSWPRTRQHFAVTFLEPRGDFNALRERLLDKGPGGTSEPIDQIAEFADDRFVLASIGFPILDLNNPGLRPDNRITVTVRAPTNVSVVWVKMPYRDGPLKEDLKSWNLLKTGEEVIEKLKSEKPDSRPATDRIELSSTTAPNWYRLTATTSATPAASGTREFSREFILTDQPEFVKAFSPLSVAVIHQTNDETTGRTPVASSIEENWVHLATLTDKDAADLAPQAADGKAADPAGPQATSGKEPASPAKVPADAVPQN